MTLRSLGRDTSAAWQSAGYRDADLPELAAELLRERLPPTGLDTQALTAELLAAPHLPEQFDARAGFGQPPVTVWRDDRLQVQVLFWLDGTTAIHEHAFCGAFGLLSGSSIHADHAFELHRELDDYTRVGTLVRTRTDRLGPGDVRAIGAGGRFVHANFHLEQPTVTVIVRTFGLAITRPQFSYMPPGLALAAHTARSTLRRQQQLMRTAARTALAGLDKTLSDIAANRDTFAALSLLLAAIGELDSMRAAQPALDIIRERFGDDGDTCVAALRHTRTTKALVGLRASLTDPGHRQLVAALLFADNRAELLGIAGRNDGAPGAGDALEVADRLAKLLENQAARAVLGGGVIGARSDALVWLLQRSLGGDDEAAISRALRAGEAGGVVAAEVSKLCFALPRVSPLAAVFR